MFLQGWMGLFFLEQKETLLQFSPVPHRSDFFNFLFQIVKWGNFAETLMYNTLYFTFASPEIQKKPGPAPLCIDRIFIAPGEDGNIQNWQSDIFLEEKLFPALFPYGIGGYMSSNVIRSSNLGFANYVKSRLLCADPKFRDDPYYLFFLLLVKEMVEMLRSESTFYRKAGRASSLTPRVLKEITPEFMVRYNTAFSAFKSLRGTSMYFQAVKKNLMAFIRQKGPPTLFVTLSSAEFQWDEMLQRIYGTCWGSKKDLDDYLHRLEEAEKRDHRKLGKEMDLFHFREESPGSVFWHEKGWALFQKLINYMKMKQDMAGYKEINTPEVLDRSLWEKSGHWQNYRDNMFVTQSESRDYAVKPMNCPGHILIFKQGIKSFKVGHWTCLMPDYCKTGLGFLLTQKRCSCSEINPYCCSGG